eukprot:2283430-Amphidinium_carterae.1
MSAPVWCPHPRLGDPVAPRTQAELCAEDHEQVVLARSNEKTHMRVTFQQHPTRLNEERSSIKGQTCAPM